MDEVLWCDGLGFVVRADDCLEMRIGGDEVVHMRGNGEGMFIGITNDGMETVMWADVMGCCRGGDQSTERSSKCLPSGCVRTCARRLPRIFSTWGTETARVNLPWRSASSQRLAVIKGGGRISI